MQLLSIPRVRLDKRLGFIDDSFHATTIGLDAFHVHPVDTFGELCHFTYDSESAVGKQRQMLATRLEKDLSLSRHLKQLTRRLCS